jgi:hypothetical protein
MKLKTLLPFILLLALPAVADTQTCTDAAGERMYSLIVTMREKGSGPVMDAMSNDQLFTVIAESDACFYSYYQARVKKPKSLDMSTLMGLHLMYDWASYTLSKRGALAPANNPQAVY